MTQPSDCCALIHYNFYSSFLQEIAEEKAQKRHLGPNADGLAFQVDMGGDVSMPVNSESASSSKSAISSKSATISKSANNAKSDLKRSNFYKLPPKVSTSHTEEYIQNRNSREETKQKLELAVLTSQLNINLLKTQLLVREFEGKSTVSTYQASYCIINKLIQSLILGLNYLKGRKISIRRLFLKSLDDP
jgi:hypothetical protein